MQWRNRSGSSNVRNSNNPSGGRRVGLGGILLTRILLSRAGGSIILILILIFLFRGCLFNSRNEFIRPSQPHSFQEQEQDFSTGQGDPKTYDEMRQFLSVALKDTEDAWNEIFSENGYQYETATLHTFTDYIQTACGGADKQIGPFYCPADQTVYIDMTFYRQLRDQFGASGDFTMSYVVSHEIGHHVQYQLGILDEVQRLKKGMSEEEANKLNVRLELQADYYAGCVAKWQDERGYLEEGDILEAINAAKAIGDDAIQQSNLGYVVPEKFTHGSSEQRKEWYQLGYRYGDLENGDTFSVPDSELFDYE